MRKDICNQVGKQKYEDLFLIVLFIDDVTDVEIDTQVLYMLLAAAGNALHLEKYFGYAAEYSVAMRDKRFGAGIAKDQQEAQFWSLEAIAVLLEERTKSNPSTFKTISMVLNRLYRKDSPHRHFTKDDCKNKWHTMFPTSHDAVATVNYLQKLQEKWPELQFHVEKMYEGLP